MADSLWTAWNCYNESIIDPTLLSKGIDSVATTKKKISDNFEEENREFHVKKSDTIGCSAPWQPPPLDTEQPVFLTAKGIWQISQGQCCISRQCVEAEVFSSVDCCRLRRRSKETRREFL